MGASGTPPQPRPLRAAVIGHTGRGGYGHGIDTALALVPGVEIVAIADPDASGREAAQARRPEGSRAARGYADYQEMLRREGPDLVAVCPRFVGEHEAMVSAAAESGARGVYCEKPFAATPAKGDRMLEACRRRGVRVVVAHRGREIPYVRWAKRLIEQEIGPQDVHDGPEDLGPLAGDGLEAYYVFRGGVTGHFESYAVDRPGARWFGLELYCARGILSLRDLPRGEVYRYPSGTWLPDEAEGRWERVLLPEWELAPDGHQRTPQEKLTESNRRNALALARAVESGGEPEGVSTARDAVAALEMVFAPGEAQRTGQRVAFPLAQRENPYALLAASTPADAVLSRTGPQK